MTAKLALADGCVFTGRSFGATGTRTGEVVFNTSMTGYQEIFTDPSYSGQIVTMTFPLQGNYGANEQDFEATGPHLSGFVVRELPRRPSNYRASGSLPELLIKHGIIGITNIDTRALTRRIRTDGAVGGVISTEIMDDVQLVRMAAEADPMVGANLVDRVTRREVAEWNETLWSPAPRRDSAADKRCHVVVLDCGIKHNILRYLTAGGCRVTVVPADTTAEVVDGLSPDGLVVGNGPGDPAAVTATIAALRSLLGKYPTLGICLGHQMLALALGAKTYKLKFGHHGGNQPVMNHENERVEITAQNHGFAVDIESLTKVGGRVTHTNLNDGSLEGFVHGDTQVQAVQFHPEASPGPHDSAGVLTRFAEELARKRSIARGTQASEHV